MKSHPEPCLDPHRIACLRRRTDGPGLEIRRLSRPFRQGERVFEAAHPSDTIRSVMQPNDQNYTLPGTALASDGGPDLFLFNGGAQARA
jgi:hypothetical protein